MAWRFLSVVGCANGCAVVRAGVRSVWTCTKNAKNAKTSVGSALARSGRGTTDDFLPSISLETSVGFTARTVWYEALGP